jgi:hypothetical protein
VVRAMYPDMSAAQASDVVVPPIRSERP